MGERHDRRCSGGGARGVDAGADRAGRAWSAAGVADPRRSLRGDRAQAAQTASLQAGLAPGRASGPQRLRRPSSPDRCAVIPREPTSSAAAVLRSRCGPLGAGRPDPSPEDRHRGRIGRLRGTVRRYDNGSDRQLHPRRRRRLRRHDPHPQHQHQGDHPARRQGRRARPRLPRATANGVEFGAGWSKAAKDTGAEYLSLKLDDPSFTGPVYANLVQSDNGEHKLIWSR